MAIDQSLIRGAYSANKPIVTSSGVAEGLSSLGESVTGLQQSMLDREKEKTQKYSDEYDAFTRQILDGSDLQGEELGKLHDNLKNQRDVYINAEPREQAIMRQDLNIMYEDYAKLEDIKDKFAGLDGRSEVSQYFTNSEVGKQVIDVLKNPSKYMETKDGRIGFQVGDEFLTVSKINDLVDSGIKDTDFSQYAEDISVKLAGDLEEAYEYDELKDGVRLNIQSYIYKAKNLNSLINDELVPGRVFKTDLIEALEDKTYSSLGITNEDLKNAKVNINDGLSEQEIENIINYVSSSKEGKNLLTDYYTEVIRYNVQGEPKVTVNVSDDTSETDDTGAFDETYYDAENSDGKSNNKTLAREERLLAYKEKRNKKK